MESEVNVNKAKEVESPKNESAPVHRFVLRILRWLPRCIKLIVSCRGRPRQQPLVFLQVLPRELRDIVRKSIVFHAHGVRPADDACGYQAIHDAIPDCEDIRLRLIGHVKPENFLFVFGERLEFLELFVAELARSMNLPYPLQDGYGTIDEPQDRGHDEDAAEPRAIIVCKLIEADFLKERFGAEQEHGGNQSKCYEVSWSKLEDIKRELGDFRVHAVRDV